MIEESIVAFGIVLMGMERLEWMDG